MQSKEDTEIKKETEEWVEGKLEIKEEIEKGKMLEHIYNSIEKLEPDLTSDKIIEKILYKFDGGIGAQNKLIEKLDNQLEYYKKRDLKALLKEIQKKKLKEANKEKDTSKDDKGLSEEEKKEVIKFLKSEGKFEEIEEVLDFYIIGERENKMILFILLSGSYSGYNSIVVIIGKSSGGKSYLTKKVLTLFPKEDYHVLTGSSDKYLQYKSKQEEFNPKALFFNEVQRNLETIEDMKDMGDEGIKYGTLEKDEHGNYIAIELVLGKVSIVATTTSEKLGSELLNRAWRLEPNESMEQNRAIVNDDYKREKHIWEKNEKEENKRKKISNIKKSMKYIENNFDFKGIAIPFALEMADLLNFNPIRVRRDKNKLKNIIKKITAWNFMIRDYVEKEGEKYLLAHPNDLKVALSYGKEIFLNITKNITEQKKRIVKAILSLDENDKDQRYFKTGEILKKLKEDKAFTYERQALRNRLNDLVENGYLEKKREGRSNAYKTLVKDIKNEKDIENIIYNAEKEYKNFINNLEEKESLNLVKKKVKERQYKYGKAPKEFIEKVKEIFNLADGYSVNSETLKEFLEEDFSKENIEKFLNLLLDNKKLTYRKEDNSYVPTNKLNNSPSDNSKANEKKEKADNKEMEVGKIDMYKVVLGMSEGEAKVRDSIISSIKEIYEENKDKIIELKGLKQVLSTQLEIKRELVEEQIDSLIKEESLKLNDKGNNIININF